MRFLFFALIIMSIVSCQKRLNVQRHGQIVLIDSVELDTSLTLKKRSNGYGFYPIYYLGAPNDTILLGKQISRYNFDGVEVNGEKILTDLKSVTISVDTSIQLTDVRYIKRFSKENIPLTDSIEKNQAYAIVIRNNSDSSLYIGQFAELGNTVMQFKNLKGQWVDIEKSIEYFCGTGAKILVLEPKQVLIAKLIRYEGDYKAECRLKFTHFGQNCYSNSFRLNIDKNVASKLSN